MELSFPPLGPRLHRSLEKPFAAVRLTPHSLNFLSLLICALSLSISFSVSFVSPSSNNILHPPVPPPPSCRPPSSVFHPLQGLPGFPGVLGRPVGSLLLAGMLELWRREGWENLSLRYRTQEGEGGEWTKAIEIPAGLSLDSD